MTSHVSSWWYGHTLVSHNLLFQGMLWSIRSRFSLMVDSILFWNYPYTGKNDRYSTRRSRSNGSSLGGNKCFLWYQGGMNLYYVFNGMIYLSNKKSGFISYLFRDDRHCVQWGIFTTESNLWNAPFLWLQTSPPGIEKCHHVIIRKIFQQPLQGLGYIIQGDQYLLCKPYPTATQFETRVRTET